ncbi:hypothetical protein [Neptunicoccus sediminis]|uniref:hypothetical protein n=1 Tax=Neptunicoccus sediminis TaxID=1892596 RepID=UPI000845C30F|nr:hypothetical protein [Neptunicoccus sediminis]
MAHGVTQTLTAGLLLLALGAGQGATARQAQMSLEQAVEVCTERAVKFGRKPYGLYGDEPPPYRVQTEYRACVWAYSKQYPDAPVDYRDPAPTVLRNLFK